MYLAGFEVFKKYPVLLYHEDHVDLVGMEDEQINYHLQVCRLAEAHPYHYYFLMLIIQNFDYLVVLCVLCLMINPWVKYRYYYLLLI